VAQHPVCLSSLCELERHFCILSRFTEGFSVVLRLDLPRLLHFSFLAQREEPDASKLLNCGFESLLILLLGWSSLSLLSINGGRLRASLSFGIAVLGCRPARFMPGLGRIRLARRRRHCVVLVGGCRGVAARASRSVLLCLISPGISSRLVT
jgi:hypothetical protein